MRFIFLVLLSLCVFNAYPNTGYVANYLSAAQFTTRVNNRTPVDNITKLTTDYKKVYFFTEVRDCNACDVEHQWWYRGIKISSVSGKIKSEKFRWWTSKNLNTDFVGDITVKVLINDEEVHTKTFTYYNPTQAQRRKAPVQEMVHAQESNDCELQLRYFSDKVEANPDDPYFEFMLNKWGKRCSGE